MVFFTTVKNAVEGDHSTPRVVARSEGVISLVGAALAERAERKDVGDVYKSRKNDKIGRGGIVNLKRSRQVACNRDLLAGITSAIFRFDKQNDNLTMKLIKYLLAVAALTTALTLSAKADLMFLGAVDFNNGPNSPSDNLAALQAFGVDTTNLTLCTDIEDAGGVDTTIDVHPGEFLVVHYGVGPGGTGSGGSFEFFEVINGETSVTVPGTGGVAGDDPYGHGGVSSIRGFCPPGVPDSGTTAMLLGLGLTGMAALRAKFGRH